MGNAKKDLTMLNLYNNLSAVIVNIFCIEISEKD
jgi:hypothetical protein